MNKRPFDDGKRCNTAIGEYLNPTASLPERRTIAQSIRRSSDPYRASITSFIRREVIRSEDGQSDKKIFHFEDGSFLTFMVSYAAIEDGCA
jgi:hypothetical protein